MFLLSFVYAVTHKQRVDFREELLKKNTHIIDYYKRGNDHNYKFRNFKPLALRGAEGKHLEYNDSYWQMHRVNGKGTTVHMRRRLQRRQ